MNKIKNSADNVNVPCGVHVVNPSPDELQHRLADGYRFLAYSMDAVFLNKSTLIPVMSDS